jgi:hypothetical protein
MIIPHFTKEANQIWQKVPENIKPKIIKNVWCGHCLGVTTIIKYHGYVDSGSLILKGVCEKCGNEVARLVENE